MTNLNLRNATNSFMHIVKWLMQVGVFNMGSTVVLVFQAPTANTPDGSSSSSDFRFCVKHGDRVRVGEALGRWKEEWYYPLTTCPGVFFGFSFCILRANTIYVTQIFSQSLKVFMLVSTWGYWWTDFVIALILRIINPHMTYLPFSSVLKLWIEP